jgi:hypothetical protein
MWLDEHPAHEVEIDYGTTPTLFREQHGDCVLTSGSWPGNNQHHICPTPEVNGAREPLLMKSPLVARPVERLASHHATRLPNAGV